MLFPVNSLNKRRQTPELVRVAVVTTTKNYQTVWLVVLNTKLSYRDVAELRRITCFLSFAMVIFSQL